MSKFEKKVILIAIVIIFILGGILFFIINQKSEYTLDKVISMINNNKLPENAHIKSESYTEMDGFIRTTDYYIKGNKIYVKDSSNVEILYDLENLKQITIINPSKIINMFGISENIDILGRNKFLFLANNYSNTYKYYGKETINENQCIKISLTDESSNIVSITYFYIDLENNYIVKYENYEGNNVENLKLNSEESFEYEFNSVKDNDILSFDIENYPDYEQLSNE